jgi:hypothetical protein
MMKTPDKKFWKTKNRENHGNKNHGNVGFKTESKTTRYAGKVGPLARISTGRPCEKVRRGSKSMEHNVDNVCTTRCCDGRIPRLTGSA